MEKKNKRIRELLAGQWCPLFGKLPKIPATNKWASRCINIIENARFAWSVPTVNLSRNPLVADAQKKANKHLLNSPFSSLCEIENYSKERARAARDIYDYLPSCPMNCNIPTELDDKLRQLNIQEHEVLSIWVIKLAWVVLGDLLNKPTNKRKIKIAERLFDIYHIVNMSNMSRLDGAFREVRAMNKPAFIISQYMARQGRKAVKQSKMNEAILLAVRTFLSTSKKPKESNKAIAKRFKRIYSGSKYIDITVYSVKYEVFYDGEKIHSMCPNGEKGKYHNKPISYATFEKTYISKAKQYIKG